MSCPLSTHRTSGEAQPGGGTSEETCPKAETTESVLSSGLHCNTLDVLKP